MRPAKLGSCHSFEVIGNRPFSLFNSSVESKVSLEEAPDIVSAPVLHWAEQAHFSSEVQGV